MFSLRRWLLGFKGLCQLLPSRLVQLYNRTLAENPLVQLVYGVTKGTGDHLAGDMAASIAYYAILSIFPLLLGIIAILAFFLPQAAVKEQIFQFFASYLPGSVDLIQENISSVISARGPLGIVGIAGLIWTGSQVFGGVNRVINQAWGIRQFRPFWLGKPRDIAMALSTGLLFFIAISSTTFDSIIPAVDLPVVGALSDLLSHLVSFLVALAAFTMLYKFLPNTRTYWSRIWPGALFAAVVFEVARGLFIFFVTNFTNWSLIYGQIGSVIAFLIWVYVSTYILIVGAEFCAEFDRMRRGIKQDARLCKIANST